MALLFSLDGDTNDIEWSKINKKINEICKVTNVRDG